MTCSTGSDGTNCDVQRWGDVSDSPKEAQDLSLSDYDGKVHDELVSSHHALKPSIL